MQINEQKVLFMLHRNEQIVKIVVVLGIIVLLIIMVGAIF